MTQQLTTRRVTAAAFSREAVEALSRRLDEPQWLRGQRLAAWELADRLPFPSGFERAWKYLNPDRLRIEGMRLPDAESGARLHATACAATGHKDPLSGTLVMQNGVPVCDELEEAARAGGVIFSSLESAVRDHPNLVRPYLGTVVEAAENVFVALNAAFWTGGVFVYVPKDVKVELPLHAVVAASGADLGLFPRVLVVAERGADVALVDEHAGGDGAIFVSTVREFLVGDEATVRHYTVQQWGQDVQEVFFQRAVVGRNAHMVTATAGLGGAVHKGWIEASIRGTGATSEIYGLAYGTGSQYFDVITLQEHIGEHTVSDLLIKAALRDSAQSAYYGLTRVGRYARMADANQEDRNLLLSDKAKAEADPVLEILTSEVQRCAHGASAGPVDQEQLFYLETRGLPRPEAEKLLVQGFLGDVLRRIADESARVIMERAVLAKLGA